MSNFEITGGCALSGRVMVSGAKNVALKAILAGILTNEKLTIHNVPDIRDFATMVELVQNIGLTVERTHHTAIVQGTDNPETRIPLSLGDRVRTSVMALGPLLARFGHAQIPNPGGCRIGARPIDRHIEGLQKMGATITYNSTDGYFYAEAQKLKGIQFRFNKPTHTGTEALLLTAVLISGETILENCAKEPEIDDLIILLNQMGGKIRKIDSTTIHIEGVEKMHGTEFSLMPDRNEVVTFAIGALLTQGDVVVDGAQKNRLTAFLEKLDEIGGGWEEIDENTMRFFYKEQLRATDVVTRPHPGFMTDWQAPWAVLMTQARGVSTIHETIFENRFSYVSELKKTSAKIELFNPEVNDPEVFYHFNKADDQPDYFHAIRITGPTQLHEGVLHINDLRAGATLILAALTANGTSTINGAEIVDRGYEQVEQRFSQLGASIKRRKE